MYKTKKYMFLSALLLLQLVFLSACSGTESRISVVLPDVGNTYGDDSAGGAEAEFDPQVYSVFAWNDFSYIIPIETSQIILVASEGSQANFWVFNREDDGWSDVMGPRYCVIGAGGLSGDIAGEEGRTPRGLMKLGESISSSETTYYSRQLMELETDFISDGYSWSDSGVRIYGAETLPSGTADGSIAVEYDNLGTLISNIDDASNPLMLVVSAESLGWELEEDMPSDFVYLTDAVPGILEEARYATSHNFTGAPLPGYYGERVVVSVRVAEGLEKAQEALNEQGLGLLAYDGYRPTRAVNRMMQWIGEQDSGTTKAEFYPSLTKADIKSMVYVASPSSHSRGAAIDLTIVDLETGQPLDMGGGFDFFDSSSSYYSDDVTQAQFENRKLLRQVMIAAGFTPYNTEWWHFNIGDESGLTEYYNFAIAK